MSAPKFTYPRRKTTITVNGESFVVEHESPTIRDMLALQNAGDQTFQVAFDLLTRLCGEEWVNDLSPMDAVTVAASLCAPSPKG